jgi:small ligand-binding sensory domain FIST
MVADIKRRADSPPRAALYFSCIARGPNLFGKGSVELRTIADILGDIPLIGFFANGEISNNRLYGYTGVLTLLL